MQDKLTLKELQNAQLYYNLGNFLGNNYQSAIITARNAIKSYPYSKYKEDFEMLILKSKFQEARRASTSAGKSVTGMLWTNTILSSTIIPTQRTEKRPTTSSRLPKST